METTFEPIKTVFGVFDGETMVSDSGAIHYIPPNYISKSKLVEGDELKLHIYNDGTFIFKQIKPVPRKRVKGMVTEEMKVSAGGRDFRINHSSLTFFRAKPGDEAVILIPAGGLAVWAALENVIKDEY